MSFSICGYLQEIGWAIMTGSQIEFGVITTILLVVFKIIDGLVSRLKKEKSSLTKDEQDMLGSLYDLHNKFDLDGVPLWYVPRSFSAIQKELLDKLSVIVHHQERTTYILERVVSKLDSVNK